MESVLVGVDRSEAALRSVDFAMKRARINTWRVTIAHVINWSRYSFPTHEENERRPVRRREELADAQAEIIDPIVAHIRELGQVPEGCMTTVIRHGRPSEVLAELATEGSHDLIVVGRVGDSNLKEAIFGSTPDRLVRHSSVPVLVVP